MEQEIQELKAMMRETVALSRETNAMVRSLRNRARWETFWKLFFWAIIIGTTVASYYVLLPYLTLFTQTANQVQSGADQAQNFVSNAQATLQHTIQGLKQ